jgi:hypothetical protein
VDTDLTVAVPELAHRERVVDLGCRVIVDREGAHVSKRQVGKRRQRSPCREVDPLGKGLRDKRVVVVVVRRRNRAAWREQRDRIGVQRKRRGGQRLHSSVFLSGR